MVKSGYRMIPVVKVPYCWGTIVGTGAPVIHLSYRDRYKNGQNMDKIDELEKTLASFEKKIVPTLNSIKVDAKKLEESIPGMLSSWSGSWFGYQSRLYYGDFESPPLQDRFSVEWGSINGFSDKWRERSSEDVKKGLEKISNISIDELERAYKSLINIVEDFYDDTSLVIKTDQDMQSEITKENLIEGQKKLKHGEEGKKYLKNRLPTNLMTRDSEALSEGVFTPSIIYYESFAKEILSNVELVYKNIKSFHYFIRWMKAKKIPVKKTELIEQPTSLYIRDEIIEAIKQKKDKFNYKKLLKLIGELNKNYLDSNVFSTLALIRAITDHIPPLLGYENFEELANNYKWGKTDRNYVFTLLRKRPISDDSLHRPISKSEDLIEVDNIPDKIFLNRLLQECIDKTVAEGFKHKKTLKNDKQPAKKVAKDPNLRPLVTAEITSLRGGSDGYFAEFNLVNVGKGLAILKEIIIGGTTVPFRAPTLSEKEKYHIVTGNLEGTPLRIGTISKPKLEIVYENINMEIFRTTYDIELKNREDKKYNIDKFTNPKFKDD